MKGLIWRLEMFESGEVKFRRLPGQLEQESAHRTLCFCFNLDPASYWFELPSTAYGVGSASADQARGRRLVNGYVMRGPRGTDPVGTLTRVEEHEKMPDVDPHDRRDFFNLNQGR